jgi:small subunit ribosomal protein S20
MVFTKIGSAHPINYPVLRSPAEGVGLSGFEVKMANTKSAKKATRKIERRTAVNRARRSRMRTYVKKVEEALRTGDAAAATAAFAEAQPALIRAAQLGVVHRNTASRKVSRLSKAIKGMTA